MTYLGNYREAYKKHCQGKLKHVLLFQKGNHYSIYSFPDLNTNIETFAKICSLNLSEPEDFSVTNPKMTGFPIGEKSLKRYFTTLYDNDYSFTLYKQEEDDTSKRTCIGTFNKNRRYQLESEIEEENVDNIYCVIVEKEKESSFLLYFVYLDLYTGNIFFGELEEKSIDGIMSEFFSSQCSIKECLIYVHKFNKKEKEETQTILSQYNNNYQVKDYIQESMKKIKDLTNECFSNHFEIYEQLYENGVYTILKYLKETDPSRCKNLYFNEENYKISSRTTYLKKNMDLVKELYIHPDIREERSYHARCKSLFHLLSHNMNAMSKRELSRRLDSPFTNPKDIIQMHEHIENSNISYKDLMNQPDFERFFFRYQNNNLKRELIADFMMKYKSMISFYPELEKVFVFMEQTLCLEKIKNGDKYFLTFYPDEIREKIDWLVNMDERIAIFLKNFKTDDVSFSKDELVFIIKDTTKKNKKIIKELENTNDIEFLKVSSFKCRKFYPKQMFRDLIQYYESYSRTVHVFQDDTFRNISNDLFEIFHETIKTTNDKIAKDGMFSALKDFFIKKDYCKPKVVERSTFSFHKIMKGRHPICEENFGKSIFFTPFDSQLNRETNGNIIFGCNTMGKSTYLKMIGIHLYLAQCGFFVPCREMEFYPYKQIFSQFCHRDNLFEQQSLFHSDLKGIQNCYDRSQENFSLILADEMLNSTDIKSSLSLFLAYINHFQKKNIKFILSSHNHTVAEGIQFEYKNRILLKCIQKKEQHETIFLSNDYERDFSDREMVDGTGSSEYGIKIAKEKFCIPTTIIESAESYKNKITISYSTGISKSSKYNSEMKVDACRICGKVTNLHVHHIYPQKNFNNKNSLQGFKKDGLYNLVGVCDTCHQKIHDSSK